MKHEKVMNQQLLVTLAVPLMLLLLMDGCITAENQTTTVVPPAGNNRTSFDSYLNEYNKKYVVKYRIDRRKNAFEKNLEEIESHNQQFQAGKSQFQMGVNVFADLDNELYKKRMVRMRDTNHRKMDVEIADELVGAPAGMPDSLDWREKGFVTDMANQKTCGSCYAFSIAYAISGQIVQRIGRMELVSEQQLVDCSTSAGNQGCAGGSLRYALKYLESCGGIMRASDYPYTGAVSIGTGFIQIISAKIANPAPLSKSSSLVKVTLFCFLFTFDPITINKFLQISFTSSENIHTSLEGAINSSLHAK
ncbi:procathepsin L-like [Topomyia yanbarensis]|uniref:procathepsin L-like n=1 Tax=Topomyia yanbarensis TaxID=2498891 RepID=UPI00273B95F1|nr:procathepsin L-like [Topomyia yanbarensis]